MADGGRQQSWPWDERWIFSWGHETEEITDEKRGGWVGGQAGVMTSMHNAGNMHRILEDADDTRHIIKQLTDQSPWLLHLLCP